MAEIASSDDEVVGSTAGRAGSDACGGPCKTELPGDRQGPVKQEPEVVPRSGADRNLPPSGRRGCQSAQWWHPSGATDDFSAIGVYGQYIYVNPANRTVIVKLSDHGTEQDEQETIDAMRDLSRSLRD